MSYVLDYTQSEYSGLYQSKKLHETPLSAKYRTYPIELQTAVIYAYIIGNYIFGIVYSLAASLIPVMRLQVKLVKSKM